MRELLEKLRMMVGRRRAAKFAAAFGTHPAGHVPTPQPIPMPEGPFPRLWRPSWRVGNKVPLHVYEGNDPIGVFHDEVHAHEAVLAVNRLRRIPDRHDAQARDADRFRWMADSIPHLRDEIDRKMREGSRCTNLTISHSIPIPIPGYQRPGSHDE